MISYYYLSNFLKKPEEMYDVNTIIENMMKEKDGKVGNSNVVKL